MTWRHPSIDDKQSTKGNGVLISDMRNDDEENISGQRWQEIVTRSNAIGSAGGNAIA